LKKKEQKLFFDIFEITIETKIILIVNTKFGSIVLHCGKETRQQFMKLFMRKKIRTIF